jgi:hypothetical protein
MAAIPPKNDSFFRQRYLTPFVPVGILTSVAENPARNRMPHTGEHAMASRHGGPSCAATWGGKAPRQGTGRPAGIGRKGGDDSR